MFIFSQNLFRSPVIPIDFTDEEINACKKVAIDSFLEQNPHLKEKEAREKLDIMDKSTVVEYLNRLFEHAVMELRKVKEQNENISNNTKN